MSVHASRNTTTGLAFEERTKLSAKKGYIDLGKTKLYAYMKDKGIDWSNIISRQLRPDEAFFNEDTGDFVIYEKKYQETEGSADEKPQTCGFKIHQFKKIGYAIGATNVNYIYILSDWFKQPKYKDMLDYIKSVDNCDYVFANEKSA